MVFKILTDQNTRIAALRAGQIQFAWIDAQGAQALQSAQGITTLHRTVANVTLQYINVYQKPLNDARVRKAIRMAVDTNEVMQKAAFGQAVASGPVPTGYGDWYLDPKVLPYNKPDIDGAKKLLAEAGYPNGAGLSIQMKCSPLYPQYVATTLVVQDSLKRIGVDAQVVQEEWGYLRGRHKPVRSERRHAGRGDLLLGQHVPSRSRRVSLPVFFDSMGTIQLWRLPEPQAGSLDAAGARQNFSTTTRAPQPLRGDPADAARRVAELVVVRRV